MLRELRVSRAFYEAFDLLKYNYVEALEAVKTLSGWVLLCGAEVCLI